jgi:FMN phosphatase YigB (HAD superfamily)
MALPSKVTTLLFDFANVLMFSGGVGEERYVFNNELIEFVGKYRESYPAYVFSNLPPTVLKQSESTLIPPFISLFSARKLDLSKTKPESYLAVAEIIQTTPNQILFCDDQLHNIEAASQAGLQTIQFESTDHYIRKVTPLLI